MVILTVLLDLLYWLFPLYVIFVLYFPFLFRLLILKVAFPLLLVLTLNVFPLTFSVTFCFLIICPLVVLSVIVYFLIFFLVVLIVNVAIPFLLVVALFVLDPLCSVSLSFLAFLFKVAVIFHDFLVDFLDFLDFLFGILKVATPFLLVLLV
jgi:hypothetical protein